MNEKKAYLVLENGKVFCGYAFGASGETVGEIAITTSMVGYLETLTDPAFFGQIVVQTFPSIGNYGVIASDLESDAPVLQAYIVREWCQEPSNFRCEGDLDTFLKTNGIIGLYGIDTRELTRIVRANGVMNAKVTTDISDVDAICAQLSSYKITDAVASVTTKAVKTLPPEGAPCAKVGVIDLGTKREFVQTLVSLGCEVTVYPASVTASQLKEAAVDGVFLSSGPGDPAENKAVIETVKELIADGMPLLGIGLGHQVIALAHGAEIRKMKYGHIGGSQPSAETIGNRVHNTPQNHVYTVVEDSLPDNAVVTFKNVNDGDVEGLAYEGENVISVQFYPTRDTKAIYGRFVEMMTGGDKVCR